MAFDETALRAKHEFSTLRVRSSTQISSRTSAIISAFSSTDQEKPTLIALTAETKTTGKLISIVEIAKRELESKGVKVHQYNGLSSVAVEVDRKSNVQKGRKHGERSAMGSGAGNEESDDAFEPVSAAAELGPTKRRDVPVMTIYLSNTSIRELKAAFG